MVMQNCIKESKTQWVMKMRDDFAAFILTHGRADNVITYETLKKIGYTGRVYIVIDNEDGSEADYRARYGDKVIVFDKDAVSKTFDTADNNKERRTVVFARNACFDIANKLGLKYFLELDDDYTSFSYRSIKEGELRSFDIEKADLIFEKMIDFLEVSGALTVAFAQAGDLIGGIGNNNYKQKVSRKAMNTFFCSTERPFKFVGRINEDVNTYVTMGMRGQLMFTVADIIIRQKATQTNSGGMSDVYLDSGTYLKSFYTVLYEPSCTTVERMGGDTFHRIHHRIEWGNCTPKIINQKYRKA